MGVGGEGGVNLLVLEEALEALQAWTGRKPEAYYAAAELLWPPPQSLTAGHAAT